MRSISIENKVAVIEKRTFEQIPQIHKRQMDTVIISPHTAIKIKLLSILQKINIELNTALLSQIVESTILFRNVKTEISIKLNDGSPTGNTRHSFGM